MLRTKMQPLDIRTADVPLIRSPVASSASVPRRICNGAQLRFDGCGVVRLCLAQRLADPLGERHSLPAGDSLNL